MSKSWSFPYGKTKVVWKFSKSQHQANDRCSIYFFFFIFFNFIFKLYIIVLVLPNIKMNPPQVYMCSPSWTLLPPSSPYHPSGSSQCTSPKHPVSCIEPGLASHFIHDILHVSMLNTLNYRDNVFLYNRSQQTMI